MAPSLSQADEQRFIALVQLLSLRNGGQLDTGSGEDDAVDGEAEDHVDEDDGDTVHPRQLSGIDNNVLKQRFLDRLAEVASRDKGGKQVSCSVLQESDDAIIIHLSRNEGFDKTDKDFFKKLEKSLVAICSKTDSFPARQALWKRMLQYNEPRLEQYVRSFKANIRSFRRSDDGTDPSWLAVQGLHKATSFIDDDSLGPYSEQTHASYMAYARAQLQDLIDIVEPSSTRPPAEIRTLLVEKAHFARHLKSVKLFLRACLSASLASKLLSDVLFLGRLRSAYLTFIDTVHNHPAFSSTSIVLVTAPKPRILPLRQLTLGGVFEVLSLPLDDTSVKNHVHSKLTARQAQEKYAELQKRASKVKHHTHAEVQLVVHLARLGVTSTQVFPYIGCSKLSCFLCSAFLRSHVGLRFKTRGCHGKLYTLWSVPDVEGLSGSVASQLSSSAAAMENFLAEEIRKPIHMQAHVAESSAGYTVQTPMQSDHMHLLRARRAYEREVDYLLSLGSSDVSDHRLSSNDYDYLADQESQAVVVNPVGTTTGECTQCERETSRKCSKCHGPWLCSERCQQLDDTPPHIFKCSPGRPIDSADRLYAACISDLMPDDEDTLEDFGFLALPSFSDRSNLLGLYEGLLLPLNVNPRDLHLWQQQGSLAKNIIQRYEELPVDNRGGYYPWFLENQHVVDPSVEHNRLQRYENFYAVARPHLDPADRAKPVEDLEPKAKQYSFVLYSVLLQGWHPNPANIPEIYYEFGFCTCTTARAETEVTFLYTDLIQRCTFKDFWTAHESKQLVALFDAHGLAQKCRRIRNLATFLAIGPDDPCPSVWDLILFLNTEGTDAPRYLLVDYGFLNCTTARDRLELKDAYKRLLPKIDPMDLHTACIQGKLYDFASQHLPMSDRFRRLMKNPYPLPEL